MLESSSGFLEPECSLQATLQTSEKPFGVRGTAMSRHTRSKRNRQSRNAQARRRRVVGWGTSAGAVVAFGLGPWGVAPAAHADGLDVILDPIINSLSSVDPLLGVDVSTLLGDVSTASGWDSVVAD